METKYFKKANNIDVEYLHTDKHIHSVFTDGDNEIKEIAEYARYIGLNGIAVTDHIRKDSTYFKKYCDEIDKVEEEVKLKIFKGFEAKISNLSGEIDVSDQVVSQAEICIGSVHRFPVGQELIDAKNLSSRESQDIELELALAIVRSGQCNVIGHPGGMSLKSHGVFSINFFEKIISECTSCGVAFELNGFYHSDISEDLIDLLKKYDTFVSLGSDAHKLSDIGNFINKAGDLL